MTSIWTPAVRLGESSWAGLVRDTVYVGGTDSPQREVDLDHPVGLLPLLKRSLPEVVEEIATSERLSGIAQGSFLAKLAVERLPAVAVALTSEYWAALALDWLQANPELRSVDLLSTLGSAEWASQNTRNRAAIMARRGGAPDADRLGFGDAEARAFEFLVSDLGYTSESNEPLLRAYRRGEMRIEVGYDWWSHELDVTIEHPRVRSADGAIERFSLGYLARVYEPGGTIWPQVFTVSTAGGMRRLVDELATSTRLVLEQLEIDPDAMVDRAKNR